MLVVGRQSSLTPVACAKNTVRNTDFDGFASHDWGCDGQNHAKVQGIVRQLQTAGCRIWLDSDRLTGGENMLDALSGGIDSSAAVVIFVTNDYMNKVAYGDEGDYVRREFMYACHRKTPMIAVRMDDTPVVSWFGPVAMRIGCIFYVDLIDDHDAGIARLIERLRSKQDRTSASIATPRHRFAPVLPTRARNGKHDLRSRIRALTDVVPIAEPDLHMVDVVSRLMCTLGVDGMDNIPFIKRVEMLERHVGIEECLVL